jgi:dimethylaniline monooxygenase (N-oxide forming)
VLVVGGGESGADIAAEVSEHASETVLSLRRGVAVVRRRFRGFPNDYRLSRITHSAAHWITLTTHPRDDGKRRLYHAVFLPVAAFDRAARAWASWLDLVHALPLRSPRAAIRELRTRLRCRAIIASLLRQSGGAVLEQFGTKSDEFVRALADGRCRRVGAIRRLDHERVVFEDGSTFEPDLVILCTGFEPTVPFLDDALVKADRFLHMIDPVIGPRLAFIGFVRPAHGAIPPVAELQARYLARLLSGRAALPGDAEMRASMARIADTRQFGFRAVRDRLAWLVDYTSFCDEIAARIGCKPTRAALRRERPGVRLRFYMAPFVAAQYRLVGPHARPDIARQVIGGLRIAHPIAMLAAFSLRWTLSRLMHRILGDGFAPKLKIS